MLQNLYRMQVRIVFTGELNVQPQVGVPQLFFPQPWPTLQYSPIVALRAQ
eukprot:COSAG06_NODE_1487_length_9296_cov_19.025226_5_plen_50_part_00